MIGRMVKKDISRNKVITTVLFLFILLAAMLVSGAVNILTTLLGAMEGLFVQSHAPHYVQMHTGDINQNEIDTFAESNSLVKSQQTVTMLGIDGTYIYLGDDQISQAESIIENSFVTQNKDFDFLLDTESNIIHVNDGEIAVPIYHMQEYGLQPGDTVRIAANNFDMEFTITDFIRDVQMNPSIVTSKRFLVSDNDWKLLQNHVGEVEYLIEFLLYDTDNVGEFEAMYQASSLPQKDTAVTYSLYRVLNAITDGIVAAVILLISVLLIAIAALCLRFTLTAAIEEDYREIGVMKAIGISSRHIRRLYLLKYVAVGGAASLLGYVISFLMGSLFTENITLYMGTAPKSIGSGILSALGALLVFLFVVIFCRVVLRRFRKISPVEAIRDAVVRSSRRGTRKFRLSRSSFGNVNIYLGVKDVFGRFGTYGILCFIFIICMFLMVVPQSFLNTLKSPDFVSYMGAGRSDIRIDIFNRQGDELESRYEKINEYLESDSDIKKYDFLVTAAYKVQNDRGIYENIKMEIGDFSTFPLEYVSGSAPISSNQIALSSMNADELGKSVGDAITLLVENQEHILTVSGIYQDVTNGGKTAKGLLPYDSHNALWCIVNIQVADGINVTEKIDELNHAFSLVKVTDMEDYVSQTLGGVIEQLSIAAILAFILAVIIALLITAMFFKMLIAKDASRIAVMRSLGFSNHNVQLQYITRAILVLLVGVVVGSIAAVTLGQGLAGMFISGISNMKFIINPFMSFLICPLVLTAVVAVTVFCVSKSIKNLNIMLIAQ